MRDLHVPASPHEHARALLDLLGPLGEHPYLSRVVWYLVATKAPLRYRATDQGEHQNLSNWFGLINERTGFYEQRFGDPRTRAVVHGLYVAHELAHLLTPTPHYASQEMFALAFDNSERYASYVTELGVYAVMPELMDGVPWHPLLARVLSEAGVDLADAPALIAWRDAVVAQPNLLANLPTEAARIAGYGGNRDWARRHWELLESIGVFDNPIPAHTSPTTEKHLVADGPPFAYDVTTAGPATIELERWQRLVIGNVKRAFVLTGHRAPAIADLAHARVLASRLDGAPLAVAATLAGRATPPPTDAAAPAPRTGPATIARKA